MVVDFKEILNDFKTRLEAIEKDNTSILDCARNAIILSRNILHTFKKEIEANGFKSKEQEIEFFKCTKQIPLVPLIYYSEVRSFELQFPRVNANSQKKFVKKKMDKLNRFFGHNLDFFQYVEGKCTHFDVQFYTRSFLDSFHIVSSKFYFQDPEFTTSRDMLLGKLQAYQKLTNYLQHRLVKSNEVMGSKTNGRLLNWTASKTALTELIYALHYNRVINNGNSDIKVIAETLQKVLHFDLGDFYKTFSERWCQRANLTDYH